LNIFYRSAFSAEARIDLFIFGKFLKPAQTTIKQDTQIKIYKINNVNKLGWACDDLKMSHKKQI